MLVWKEIIRPGPYWYMDQDTGKPRKLVATPEGVRYLHQQGQKMLSAGLSVPVPLEHDLDVKAMTPADKAAARLKNNTGWAKKYAILPGDRLFAQLDIEDEEVYKKLPRTIKYTSPWISSFTDGNGQRWDGVISHIALTSRPRITRQAPFGSVAAALSLATEAVHFGPGKVPSAKGLIVSRAGLLDVNGAPCWPAAFSIMLAEGDMPPGLDKKGDGEETPPEAPPPETEEMGLVDILCDVVSALWGIELPDGTSEENLAQNLMKGLMEHLKSKGLNGQNGADMSNQPNEGSNDLPSNPVVQESSPMYMSLNLTPAQVEAITDPVTKQLAGALLSLQSQNTKDRARSEALAKNTLTAETRRRDQRIASLAKKLPPDARQMLLSRAQDKGAALSLGDDGSVRDPLSSTLEIIEAGIRDIPTILTTPSAQLSEVPHPESYLEMSEERRQAVVAEYARNTHLPENRAG